MIGVEKMKKLTVYAAITLFTVAMPVTEVYPDGNYLDTKMKKNSRVMSPSMIKIDDQKSKSVKRGMPPMVTTEEQIRRINQDLEKSMDETRPDKVKPVLKGPKGGRGEGEGPARDKSSATVTIPANNYIVEVGLNEISEATGLDKGEIDFEALMNEHILFTWSEGGTVFGLIYDNEGNALGNPGENPLCSPGSGNKYIIRALSDGGFVVGYDQYDIKDPHSYFHIFNSQGRKQSETPVSTGTEDVMASITFLADGCFAVAWDSSDRKGGYVKAFDAKGNPSHSKHIDGLGVTFEPGHTKLITLTNGNVALLGFANYESFYVVFNPDTVFNPEDTDDFDIPLNTDFLAETFNEMIDVRAAALSNGNFVVSWIDDYGDIRISVRNSNGNALNSEGNPIGKDSPADNAIRTIYSLDVKAAYYLAPEITELSDGKFVVVFGESLRNADTQGYFIVTCDENGNPLTDAQISNSKYDENIRVHALEDGTFSLSWYNWENWQNNGEFWTYGQYTQEGQLFTPDGMTDMGRGITTGQRTLDNNFMGTQLAYNPLMKSGRYNGENTNFNFKMNFGSEYGEPADQNVISDIFKESLKINIKEIPGAEEALVEKIEPALLARLLAEALSDSSLTSLPGELTPQQVEIARMLSSMLNDPTAGQKVAIDAIGDLLEEINKLEEEGTDTKFVEASENFIKMAANALLVQALPGLLKEGEIKTVQGIFAELDEEKSKILRKYKEQTNAYYANLIKELADNMGALQVKGLLEKA